MPTLFIYGLYDSGEPDRIRYVGQASNWKRPEMHVSQSKLSSKRTHKLCWIRSVLKEGRVIEWVFLDFALSKTSLDILERRWIAWLREEGSLLTNVTEGGDGVQGLHHSKEMRERMSLARRGVPKSTEHRAKLAVHCVRLGVAKRGVPLSLKTREKMSAAKRGKQSADHIAKRVASWKMNRAAHLTDITRLDCFSLTTLPVPPTVGGGMVP